MVSQDRKLMAAGIGGTGTSDFSKVLWDVTNSYSPRETAQFGSLGEVMAFGPGRLLAVADPDGSLGLWSTTDARRPQRLGHIEAHPASASFSPDGRIIAVRTILPPSLEGERFNFVESLTLWDITDPQRPRKTSELPVNLQGDVLFSPRSRIVATTTYTENGGAVVLMDVSDASQPTEVGRSATVGESVRSMAFSPDGQTMAIASGFSERPNSIVTLWDIKDPRQPKKLGESPPTHANIVSSMDFSPDGTTLASADNNGVIILWNVADHAGLRQLGSSIANYSGRVLSIEFVDRNTLVSASESGAVVLWVVGAQPREINRLRAVDLSGDLKVAASVDDQTTTLWGLPNRTSPAARGSLPGHAVVLSRDGHTLLTDTRKNEDSQGPLAVWDTSDLARPRERGRLDNFDYGYLGPYDLVENLLVVAVRNTITIWDTTSMRAVAEFTARFKTGEVSLLELSPDGRLLAISASSFLQTSNEPVELWGLIEPGMPRMLTRLPRTSTATVLESAFSASRQMLAVLNQEGDVTIWDLAEPVKPGRLSTVKASPVKTEMGSLAVGVNPAGTIMATSSADGSVNLWDITDGTKPIKLGFQLAVHTSPVRDIKFSPDGKTMATVDEDSNALYWDIGEVTEIANDPIEHACARVHRGLNEKE